MAACATFFADARKIHTIGDSTMATYSESTTVTRGWGQMFQQFFTGDITVNNRAKSGASSKSFYEESAYWQSVKKQIEPGDYVIISFAHNDEKNNGCDGDSLKAYYTANGDATTAASLTIAGLRPREHTRHISENILARRVLLVPPQYLWGQSAVSILRVPPYDGTEGMTLAITLTC